MKRSVPPRAVVHFTRQGSCFYLVVCEDGSWSILRDREPMGIWPAHKLDDCARTFVGLGGFATESEEAARTLQSLRTHSLGGRLLFVSPDWTSHSSLN